MNILQQIVSDTWKRVRESKSVASAGELARRVHEQPVTRPFRSALVGDQIAAIAEVKRASPSKGPIRPDASASTIAHEYEKAGASAVSVLTEPNYFMGTLADLHSARSSCRLPILRKDFIVDPYQVLEARVHGADAILLIAASLDAGQMRELHDAASELSLECLVEVYDLEELDKIDFDRVRILGVNNRDLRTFEVDIGHSLRVFTHVPNDIARVAESGIHSSEQLITLHTGGIDAVLVGQSLMETENPGQALAELLSPVQ